MTTAKGEQHHNAKLTWKDVRKIRENPRAHTREQWAEIYDVSVATIASIIAGRSWKEDPGDGEAETR